MGPVGERPETAGVLDLLVARVLGSYPYTFTLPSTSQQREIAYRIRFDAVVGAGWAQPEAFPAGLECDEFDACATQVIGWRDGDPVCTGRLVLPPSPLPTEQACGIAVQPSGQVVDIGRMAVARAHQGFQHAAFIALLCRLYLEMRESGLEFACGMMSPSVRRLLGRLGLRLEQLGADREYWGEVRAPVRFGLTVNAASLLDQWTDDAVSG
jgi:hypothetical protein